MSAGEKRWGQISIGVSFADYTPNFTYSKPRVMLDRSPAPKGVAAEVFHFKVMWCGWECDEDGWIVEMEDGSRAVVLSSHGGLYIAKPDELREKLAEYETVIADTRKALAMLESDSGSHSKSRDTK